MNEQTIKVIYFLYALQKELDKIDPKDYDQNCPNSCALSLAIKIDPQVLFQRWMDKRDFNYIFGTSGQIANAYPIRARYDGAITPKNAIARIYTVIERLVSGTNESLL